MPGAALAWGARTHEIVNRRAIDFLPEPARSAWAPLAPALGRHASDADHRKGSVPGEPRRHFIDIDVWDEPPFDDVPRDFDELARKKGREAAERWGVVPWAIDECWRMTVLSLKRGDWGSAGAWAADLGHYVADSHQPLHCTVNYDGQNTGNDGVHLRFEVAMMDRWYDEAVLVPEGPLPDFGGDVVEFCFDWIAEAYPGLETILAADGAARDADPRYGDVYYDAMWSRTATLASDQVSRATRDLAVLILAAWEEAGSPPGPGVPPPFAARSREQLDPPAPRGSTHPGVWVAAAAAVVSAFVLGSR